MGKFLDWLFNHDRARKEAPTVEYNSNTTFEPIVEEYVEEPVPVRTRARVPKKLNKGLAAKAKKKK